MSEENVVNEIAKAEDSFTVEVFGPNNEIIRVTIEQLEELAANTSRVTKITVEGERNLNKGNFENEKFGQGTEIDFSWFWQMIKPSDLQDPVKAQRIQKAFANGAMRSIGLAYRDIYVNHLYSVASRSRQLALPQQKIILAELKSLNSALTYDPFSVVRKDS